MFQKAVFNDGVDLAHADLVDKGTDRTRCVAASAQSAEGGHSRIVPAADIAVLDERAQLALGHDGVVDAQTRELDLTGLAGRGDIVDHPVVQRTVRLKFEGAQAVGDALERVLDRMGKVVHRIHAPGIAGAVMMESVDAVDDRVAHVEVAGSEVDPGAQRHAAVGELAGSHAAEEVEALLLRSVAEGALRRGLGVAAEFAHLLGRQLADIGETFFDQLLGEQVHLLKILGSVKETVAPVEAQPLDILLDRVDVLDVLLGRVGVVHAQVAHAVVFFGGAKVDADRLGVTDMQIAVRLGRKTRVYGFSFISAAFGNILVDKVVNEVTGHNFIVDFSHCLLPS